MDTENAKAYASIKDIGRHIIDACAQWARIRGYRGSVGLLRGLIFLAKEPVSLDELVQKTGLQQVDCEYEHEPIRESETSRARCSTRRQKASIYADHRLGNHQDQHAGLN